MIAAYTSAKDWADRVILAYEGESNEELIPVIAQIQVNMLRFAAAKCRERAAIYSNPYPAEVLEGQAYTLELEANLLESESKLKEGC